MPQRVLVYRVAAAAAALVLLAACGDDKKDEANSQPAPTPVATSSAGSSSTASEPTAQPSVDPSAAGNATTINVALSEFMLKLDKTTLPAGAYTFVATNDGSIPHAFQIDGPGVEDQGTGTVQPGDDGSVTVTLQKGTYTFYCPIPGHEDKGMKVEVTVT